MCTFDLFSFLLHCTCMDVGLCEHAYCVHPMAPGWTLTKQVSQHDHWSSVTWQMKPWKGTCNCSKGKAQEIKCHPKPSGVQNPQDAVRLGDRLKRWRQLRFKKNKTKQKNAGGLVISLCYETIYWVVLSLAAEVQPQEDVGVLSCLRQTDTEANHQAW